MFHDLKKLVTNSVQRAGIGRQVEALNVVEIFTKVVNELFDQNISQQVKPAYFKNGILTVSCLSSLIMQELQYRDREIVDNINKIIGKEVVNKLSYIG